MHNGKCKTKGSENNLLLKVLALELSLTLELDAHTTNYICQEEDLHLKVVVVQKRHGKGLVELQQTQAVSILGRKIAKVKIKVPQARSL